MQIHDLNTKALTDPAYVAFDDGTDTYKTEFNDVVANAAAAAVADADLTDSTVAFTSGDAASPTAWTAVDVLTSGLSLKTLFNRISTMVKNVRYIWSKIGTASMGTTATTITGAIAEHEQDISGLNDAITLTNWTTLVNGVQYAGEGNHVFVRLNIAASLSTSFTILATLPTGKRPSLNQYFRVTGSNGTGDVTVLVDTSGNIQAKVDSGTGSAVNGFICIA